jgi:malate dehydrogenase (oxaloacetate-decarboxylating)
MDPKYKQHKNPFFGDLLLSTSGPLDCALIGLALLRNPYFNKGSAFTREERDTFELHGLLPCNVQTLDEQVRRAYHQYSTRENDLAKNTFMSSLRLQNEVLFYKVCPNDETSSPKIDLSLTNLLVNPSEPEGNVPSNIYPDRR